MNKKFHTQTCSLSSKDSGYDADNFRIRARTGTDGLSSNNLPKHSDQDKTNSEDVSHSTKKSNTEQNGQPLLSKQSSNRNQSLLNKISQLRLTKHDIIMIILNILMFITLLTVCLFLSRSSRNVSVDTQKILVTKRGKLFGGPGGDGLFNDAEIANINFYDNITTVTASESFDDNGESLLLSLTFAYTNGKSGQVFGGKNPLKPVQKPNPLHLSAGEHITEVVMYADHRNITNPSRSGKLTYIIIGISFEINHDQKISFGSTNGTNKTESYKNYFLGYALGKSFGYIDSLCFTWYKYDFKNSSITE